MRAFRRRNLAFVVLAAAVGCAESPNVPSPEPIVPRTDSVDVPPVKGPAHSLRVVVLPPLAIGTKRRYTAEAEFKIEGYQFWSSVAAAWETRDTSLFTVDTAGMVTAGMRIGSAYLVARFETKVDSALVTVFPGFDIFPDTVVIPFGRTRTLAVESFDGLSEPTPLAVSEWTSSAPAVASVDANGVVTANSAGWTTVTARRNSYAVSAAIRVLAPGPVVRFTAIAAGNNRNCGLDEAGFAWCWGRVGAVPGREMFEKCPHVGSQRVKTTTTYYRGVAPCSSIPVRMSDEVFTSITHGALGPYALTVDGRLFSLRETGVVAVAATAKFKSVSERGVLCGVRTDSVAVCGNNNANGVMGIGTAHSLGPYPVFPTPVLQLARVKQVEPGSCALTVDGEAFCWGGNKGFRLGVGPDSSRQAECFDACVTLPMAVRTSARFRSIAVSEDICAIALDGETWCWGALPAQSGIPHATAGRAVRVPGIQFKAIWRQPAVPFAGLCGTALDDFVYCLKKNATASTLESLFSFEKFAIPFRVSAISADDYYGSCALSADDGRVYCWGLNVNGWLGNGTVVGTATIETPVEVYGQRPPT